MPSTASSQTPSPLQEWQYSSGTVLEKLFEPNLPEWRVVLGAAESPITQRTVQRALAISFGYTW
jgi:hypothetical protein